MSGISERLVHLRAARVLSARELAVACGVDYSELLRLETGSRRQPSPLLLHRLAEFFLSTEEYLLVGQEPSPATLRAGFFRYYRALDSARREALKLAPIQGRLECVLHYLSASYPTLLDRTQVAPRLGYTPRALDDVLRGTAPLQSHLLKTLSSLVGLGTDFFIRGDFFGGVVPAESGGDPERLHLYYEVVQEAVAAGISPETLRRAVQIMLIRDERS